MGTNEENIIENFDCFMTFIYGGAGAGSRTFAPAPAKKYRLRNTDPAFSNIWYCYPAKYPVSLIAIRPDIRYKKGAKDTQPILIRIACRVQKPWNGRRNMITK